MLKRGFTTKQIGISIAALIIIAWVAPYFILGDDAHMRIHDNMDSNIAWYQVLKESGELFSSGSAPIEQLMNGEVTREAFYSEYYAIVWLFMIFPPVIAYGLSQLITRMVAFIGMYLLLKDHIMKDNRTSFIQIGVSLTFALVPYWPSGMLGILGMPLALWAFINIKGRSRKWSSFAVLTILPFFSSFVLGFFYLLATLGVWWLVDLIRTKKWNWPFFFSIAYMTLIFLLIDYRLVLSTFLPEELTNRDEFYQSKNGLLSTFILIFKNYYIGHQSDRSIHFFILPLALLVLVYIIFKKQWKKHKLFIGLHFFLFAISVWYAFWWYEGWQPLKEQFSILNTFNFSRFHWLSPILVYVLFAMSLKIIFDESENWKPQNIFRKKYFIQGLTTAIIVIQFIILVPFNEQIYYRNSPSFEAFFAEKQFNKIKEYIGKPVEDYRVISIGIHPAIAQFNGFYTIDSYNNIYPLTYKKEFRKIIEKELEKNKTIRTYFDHWGGRVYIFTDELGKKYMFSKNSDRVLKSLELNTEQLKKMGGEYIFAAVPILNATENHLFLEKEFSHPESHWNIYLYRVEL